MKSYINLQNNIEFVKSSCIKGFAYDVDKQALLIRFNNNKDVIYHGFPLDEYVDFQHAVSYGEHFNDYIKNDYPNEKLN